MVPPLSEASVPPASRTAITRPLAAASAPALPEVVPTPVMTLPVAGPWLPAGSMSVSSRASGIPVELPNEPEMSSIYPPLRSTAADEAADGRFYCSELALFRPVPVVRKRLTAPESESRVPNKQHQPDRFGKLDRKRWSAMGTITG